MSCTATCYGGFFSSKRGIGTAVMTRADGSAYHRAMDRIHQ